MTLRPHLTQELEGWYVGRKCWHMAHLAQQTIFHESHAMCVLPLISTSAQVVVKAVSLLRFIHSDWRADSLQSQSVKRVWIWVFLCVGSIPRLVAWEFNLVSSFSHLPGQKCWVAKGGFRGAHVAFQGFWSYRCLAAFVADQMIDPTQKRLELSIPIRILVSNFAVCWFVMSLSE